MSTVDTQGKVMCPRQRLTRKSYVSTSTVDVQGRVMCPHQRLTRKRELRVHVNG